MPPHGKDGTKSIGVVAQQIENLAREPGKLLLPPFISPQFSTPACAPLSPCTCAYSCSPRGSLACTCITCTGQLVGRRLRHFCLRILICLFNAFNPPPYQLVMESSPRCMAEPNAPCRRATRVERSGVVSSTGNVET